jgi:hypothetical protein
MDYGDKFQRLAEHFVCSKAIQLRFKMSYKEVRLGRIPFLKIF